MIVAALDLGSNSFLMLIARAVGGELKVLRDETRTVRLGEGVGKSSVFSVDALARAKQTLCEFQEMFQEWDHIKVKAVATSAARDAKNSRELIAIGEGLNIPIEIIPGPREAQLTFLGATYKIKLTEKVAVLDIGGGSTEFIYRENSESKSDEKSLHALSINTGKVRLLERFVTEQPIRSSELKMIQDQLHEDFSFIRERGYKPNRLIAVAGTPVSFATMEGVNNFDESKPFMLSLNRIQYWTDRMLGMSVKERAALTNIEPKRADVLPIGGLILMHVMRELGLSEVEVSSRGVRFGLAIEMSKGSES